MRMAPFLSICNIMQACLAGSNSPNGLKPRCNTEPMVPIKRKKYRTEGKQSRGGSGS